LTKEEISFFEEVGTQVAGEQSYQKMHVDLGRLFKKFWINNKMNTHAITFLKKEERVARAKFELWKNKREAKGTTNVA